MKKSRTSSRILSSSIASFIVAAGFFGPAAPIHAITVYWDGTGTGWNAAASWSTSSGSTTPDMLPGTGDIAQFNITSVNTAQTVNLNGNQSVLGLIFSSTGTTLLQGGGVANQTLTLGSSGITVSAAGAPTIGSATANQNVAVTLGAAQTWANNNATSVLTVVNGVAKGGFLLTSTGVGNTVIGGVVSGTSGITKTGAGTLTLSGANTYTGINTITAGVVRATVAAGLGASTAANAVSLGGGTLQLANNAGTNFGRNTTVTANSTITADRTASAATSTTHTMGNLAIGAQTLSITRGTNITGALIGGVTFGITTMTGASTFDPQTSATLTLGVVHGGANGITKTGAGTLVLNGASTHTGDTTVASGVLQINNNNGAGNGTISISSGAPAANRVVVNGGVTIFNPISFGNTVSVAGVGVIQQTGTGQATVNGPLTITGAPSAGGHFVGGAAVGNELVLGGAINSTVSLSHRAGRIIYKGGGTVTAVNPTLTVTDTALIGATNGMATNLTVVLGGSASAALDLNGFDQTLGGLLLGNAGQNFVGTVNLGAKTLTLTGDVTTQTPGGVTGAHTINAVGGTLNLGSTARTFNVSDSLSADDLAINGAAVAGAGGIVKQGTGTLALNNTTLAGPLTIESGGLQAGTSALVGSFTSGALTFGVNPTTLLMKLGTASDVINTGTLTTLGTTAVNLSQIGGALTLGTKTLINYTGASPGLGGFALGALPGRLTGALADTGSAIVFTATGNDEVVWDGTNSPFWSEGATGNWKLLSNNSVNDFLAGDVVTFPNTPTNNTVDISVNVAPSHVTFTNTIAGATDYTVTGAAGIAGATAVVKTGDANVTLINPNSYTGPTTVSAGTLELDHDAAGNVVLSGTSGVSVANVATLKLTRDDGAFTFNRNISGAGMVEINPHSVGGAAALGVVLSGNNTGFTGLMTLAAPASGTYRLTSVAATALGGATIDVQSGAQVYTATNQTYTNSILISGTGFADSAGNIGALRLENGSNWAGPVAVNGTARIGAHNAAATVSGNITGGDLEVNATNFNNNYTLIFTGTNSYGTTTIGGQNFQTVAVPSMRLNIGNGGTTGTLGSGPVTINGDGANGVLGFDRSNGYTLAVGQTLTGGGSNPARTFIDFDTLGAGFSDGGNAITLGSPLIASGGQFRVGQARANAVASFTGALTGGIFRIGSNAANATANLNSGAVANFERVFVGIGAVTSTSTLNINSGSSLTADYMTGGEVANHAGVINQATGSIVNIASQLRLGHFGTETSTYNMSGGSLTLTGASPINSPSTAAAGGVTNNVITVGDNNVNGTNPATIVGGGIYLGIDGTGIFNHTGGAVTTNWIVLDNRADSGPANNAADGIDRYTLNGAGASLSLRSTYGLIQRNASSAVVFGNGTVLVDNTGTGTGTGANIGIPLDATIDTITGTTTTLDTNGVGNGLILTRDVRGSGTLNLAGGGDVSFSTGGVQNVSANITGGTDLAKTGTGTTTLTGNLAGYSGIVFATAGRLNVPGSLAAEVRISDGAALAGEPAGITALTVGAAGGGTIFFDPNTAGALTTGTLTVNGANFLDLTALPLAAGPYTAINYTALAGGGSFAVTNAANYRVAPTVIDTGSAITVNITGRKNLTWTGANGTDWNINSAINWNDTTPAPEVFFIADAVSFPEGGANSTIALTGLLAPAGITVNADTTAYTLTATAGNQIVGATGIVKTNSGTLTLLGANAHSGATSIGGGLVEIDGTNSIGDASATNTIAISGGGRLSHIGGAAINLGANRSIAIGAGGGAISHFNATAVGITIPGNITGTEPLAFQTNSTGAGTFILSGNNSGYNGDITVDAQGTGLATVRLATSAASPAGGSITLNYPPSGVNTNATTLDLPGSSLAAGVTLNMTSFLNGAVSQRSQVTSSGIASIDGPITASGSSIVQFNSASGTLTLQGPITDGGFGFNSLTSIFFLRGVGNGVVNNTITLPGAQISKTDAGVWTINSTGNDWTSTGVLVGTLRMGVAGVLPAASGLVLGQNDTNTAVLDLNGFAQTVGSLASNPVVTNANSVGKSITSAVATTLTVDQAVNTTYASLLTGEISLVKSGGGTLTLLGANSHSGLTSVTGGVLNIQHRTALGGVTAGTTVANGAALEIQGNLVIGAEPLTINGIGTTGGALVSVSGANTYGGPITVATNATISALSGSTLDLNGGVDKTATTVTFTGGGSININGMPVFGSLSGSDLIIDGVGLTMNVASTYNGPTFIQGGGLLINGVNQALPNVTKVTLGDGTSNTDGTWFVNGTEQTIAALASAGTGAKTVALGGGTLTVDQATDTLYNGTISGTGTLEKSGVGKLALTGIVDIPTVTVDDGILDLHVALGTGTSTINATAEVNLGASQTLGELNIGDGGLVTLGNLPPPAPAFADAGFAVGVGAAQAVPEPGSMSLLAFGIAALFARRRSGRA